MPTVTAGLLMCRRSRHIGQGSAEPQFLLVHPGGPYFVRRDAGVWSIPKGLVEPGEDLLSAARREFAEETGFSYRASHYEPLGSVRQANKSVHAWAFLGDAEPALLVSNTFELEWPPKSGQLRSFPEVDRAEFYDAEAARAVIIRAQAPLIDRALAWLHTVDA